MSSKFNLGKKKFLIHNNKLVATLILIFLILGLFVPFLYQNLGLKRVTVSEINFDSVENEDLKFSVISDTGNNKISTKYISDATLKPGIASTLDKTSDGLDFSDALEISMTNGSGDEIKKGSMLGSLTSTQDFFFYKYNLSDSGPIDIKLTSPIGVDKFQFVFDVFIEEYGMPVGSAFDGNPLFFHYFSPFSGFNYLIINGFDINFGDSFDIFNGDTASFNITITQLKKGTAPKGAESKLFNSIAFDQIGNIFSYFQTNGFINEFDNIDLIRGDPLTGFDSDDKHFFKGIGLAIYGIVRAGDLVSSSDGRMDQARSDAITPYLERSIELFYLANNSANVKADTGGTNYLYVNPNPGDLATLTDNVYMLLGIGEIVYQSTKYPEFAGDNSQLISDLTDWAFTIADSIINVFEDTSCGNCAEGVYVENIFDYGGGGETQGDLVTLESMALLAEIFSELGLLVGNEILVSLPAHIDFTELGAIRTQITEKLLITYDSNTTIDLITGTDIGIGVEWWNKTSNIKSNMSTLIGNLFYALHRTSQFDVFQASEITTNILRLFTSPSTNLLYEKALIIEDDTLIPKRISTLENSLFILLAQRLENKWKEFQSNTDISRTWGRKAIENLESLMELIYDDVDNAVFGMYDDSAKKLVSDDNKPESNRFVANAFLNTILVRVFPVQMGVIAVNNVLVDESSEISLELSQIPLSDSLNWWDFIITFKFQLKVSIPTFDFLRTETVDLADFADFGAIPGEVNSKFIPIFYEPTEKGNFTIYIELSVEGRPLLLKEIELTSLGKLRAEISNSASTAFSTDDSSFTGEFTLVDNQGIAVPNLNVNTSLGLPLDKATSSKYIKTGRSDASGKVSVKFDTSKLMEDGIINQTEILSQSKIPNFIFIVLFINATNADSFNLEQAESQLKIRLQVRFATMNVRTSPTLLEITQGTTETFTFTISALNQDQEPIANAIIDYSILGVPGSSNTGFTNVDGETTISFRDNDLFGLSNLVIQNNGSTTSTNITLKITHPSYPTKTITKPIFIEANALKINANPVQVKSQRGSFFQPTKPTIDVEVATEDLFGKQIVSNVKLEWVDTNNLGLNNIVNLAELGEHQTPYIFNIDPSNLPEGNHEFLIIARKDGITTTHILQSGSPSNNVTNYKLSSSNQDIIDRPIIQRKLITIEQSNIIEDALLTVLALVSTLILAYIWTKTKEKGLVLTKYKVECPHCQEYINKKQQVCPNCGRDAVKKTSQPTPLSTERNIENEKGAILEEPVIPSQPIKEDEWPEDDPFKIGPPKGLDETDQD